jgi:hypothetical protein
LVLLSGRPFDNLLCQFEFKLQLFEHPFAITWNNLQALSRLIGNNLQSEVSGRHPNLVPISAARMQLLMLLASCGGIQGFGFGILHNSRYMSHSRIDRLTESQTAAIDKGRLSIRLPLSVEDNESDIFGEDLTYLNEEFYRLANGRTKISFEDFLSSEAIQALLADEESDEYLLDIKEIWSSQAKSLETQIDLPLFISINREVDDLFEYVDDEDDVSLLMGEDEDDDDINGVRRLSDIIEGRNSNTEEEFEGTVTTRSFIFLFPIS